MALAGPFIVLGPLTEFSEGLFSTQQSSSKVDVLEIYYAMFRISIDSMRIHIRILHFKVNADTDPDPDPDPGFL